VSQHWCKWACSFTVVFSALYVIAERHIQVNFYSQFMVTVIFNITLVMSVVETGQINI
jgi:hypothetical protein